MTGLELVLLVGLIVCAWVGRKKRDGGDTPTPPPPKEPMKKGRTELPRNSLYRMRELFRAYEQPKWVLVVGPDTYALLGTMTVGDVLGRIGARLE